MKRRSFVTICVMTTVSAAGCVGFTSETDGDATTNSSGTADDDITNSSTGSSPQDTTAPADGDSEKQASPHEFVHVRKVRNQTKVEMAKTNETADFENLSATRQQTFLNALDAEKVAANGWSYYNESRPAYVRYNGTWYNVILGVH